MVSYVLLYSLKLCIYFIICGEYCICIPVLLRYCAFFVATIIGLLPHLDSPQDASDKDL
jgi:hypothetical protein